MRHVITLGIVSSIIRSSCRRLGIVLRVKIDAGIEWSESDRVVLAKRELNGDLLLELAPGIAAARAARAAARAREEGGAITIAPRPLASPAGPASLLQLAGRAAARQQLAALKRRPPQAA